MAFQCIVLTPEQQMLKETVNQAIIPAFDGLMGILSGRAPIMVRLGIGPLRVDLGSDKRSYFMIDGGLAQMKGDTLTILTSHAIPASEIDAQAASAEYTAALATKATTPAEIEDRDKALQRARTKQSIAHM
jgi:F-type H+-transporting ATPase subunit epsilon